MPPKELGNIYKRVADHLFELRQELHGESYDDELDDKLHQLEQEFYKIARATQRPLEASNHP